LDQPDFEIHARQESARIGQAARRTKPEEVLALLADKPKGITARDVHRARIVGSADEARSLLAWMETDGELTGVDSKPETGGHIKAWSCV
jgi:hypothetical protein